MELMDRFIATNVGTRMLFYKCHPNFQIQRSKKGIRYVVIGDLDKAPLLLIHGAMVGILTWGRMARYASLYKKYYLILPERPGYGATFPGNPIASIEQQATLLLDILEAFNKPTTIMGHSYGAPIAMMMAHERPDLVKQLIGVAGQYDPDNEIIYAVMPFFKKKVFKYLLPRMIWSANEEKLHHVEALRTIAPKYNEIKVPITLIHGDEDALVPFENSLYLKEQVEMEAPLITLQGIDHPVPIEASSALVNFLMESS